MTPVNDGLNLNEAWEAEENNSNKINAVLILNSTTNRTALQCSQGMANFHICTNKSTKEINFCQCKCDFILWDYYKLR